MFNVQQITDRLAGMSDAQLQQYAQMHKDDPYILPLAASEFKRRQQTRAASQQQQAPQQTVADQNVAQMQPQQVSDQLPEQQGIGTLPAQNLAQMADGGIVGYAEGGVPRFAKKGAVEEPPFNPDPYLENPNVQAYLAYINTYEGNPQPDHLVGFKKIKDLLAHPNKLIKFNKEGDKSSAAGLYQFLGSTWKTQAKKLGLKDFSVPNQQRAAVGLLKDIGALEDVVNGRYAEANKKAGSQWASLPGSTIGASTGQKVRINPRAEEMLGYPALAMVDKKLLPADQTKTLSAYKTEREKTVAKQNEELRIAEAEARAKEQSDAAARAAANRAAPKASLDAGEEIMYSPEGIPLNVPASAPEAPLRKQITEGVKEAGTSAANLADTVWNVLPSLGAQVAYPIARATGSSPEQAQQAVGSAAADFMNPFGKAFGVTESPYYKNAPSQQIMDFITSNLTKSAKWIADQAKKQLGVSISPLDVENMQNSLLLGAPKVASKAFRGDYTVPYNLQPRARVSPEAAADAARTAEAAAAKVENPRLAYEPEGSKPQITVNPQGEAVLPDPFKVREADLLKQRGMEKLAEDTRIANIARAEAEAAKARVGESSLARSAERSPLGATVAGLSLAGAANATAPNAYEKLLSGSAAPDMTPVPPGWFSEKPGTDGKNPGESPAAKANDKTADAGTGTGKEGKKGWGISDEDLLVLGLNLMASPGGQSGNSLQQFVGDLGRAGIATLGARKEREAAAEEKGYKTLLGDYYKALGSRQKAEADYLSENRGVDTKLKMATPAITQRFNAWLKQRSAALLGEPPTQAEQDAVMAKIQSEVYKALGLTDMIPLADASASTNVMRFNPSTGKIE